MRVAFAMNELSQLTSQMATSSIDVSSNPDTAYSSKALGINVRFRYLVSASARSDASGGRIDTILNQILPTRPQWKIAEKLVSEVETGKLRRIRHKFERIFIECVQKPSICRERLAIVPEFTNCIATYLHPSARNTRMLERLLSEDYPYESPYLKWDHQELLTALAQRGLRTVRPELTSMCASECRLALEKADHAMCLRFFDLPKEIRTMVLEQALLQRGTVEIGRSEMAATLCQVSKQVRTESQEIYFSINRFTLRASPCPQSGRNLWRLPGPRMMYIHPEDYQWLRSIGPENVARLRWLKVTKSAISPSTHEVLYIDLSCSDASAWTTLVSYCSCKVCNAKNGIKLAQCLADAEHYIDVVGDDNPLAIHQKVIRCAEKKGIEKAQEALDEFIKLCGKGKTVEPTIEGLKVLVRGIAEFCSIQQARRY